MTEQPPSVSVDPIPFGDVLAWRAAQTPNRPAVTYGDVTVTFAQLEAMASRKARQLAGLGVEQGDVVTLAMPNGFELYATVFAAWKLGASPNMVASKLPAAELEAIVALAKPRLIVGEPHARLADRPFLETGSDPDFSDAPLASKISAPLKIATSGGSTGRPKLIVDKTPTVYDPGKPNALPLVGQTLLNPGPLYHNAPFVGCFQTLLAGGHVVEMGRFDPERALELIERHKVVWVNFVPTMMQRIWRLPPEQRQRHDLGSLKAVFHMGSVCPVWLKQAWIDWLGPDRIFEVYGGTELIGMTVISGREWLAHPGSVGKVQAGSRMRVLDEQGQDCAPGEIGEIYFLPDRGRNSTYEYIGAEAKAAGDWETLGDLGYLDADGYLYIADRRTDMIVSGGANIFPAEVESVLDSHPDIDTSVVVGLPDQDLGQRAHAIVQLTPAGRTRGEVDDDALRAFLSDKLVRYKIPRTFEFTDQTLRDEAGKVRRSALRDARITPDPAPAVL